MFTSDRWHETDFRRRVNAGKCFLQEVVDACISESGYGMMCGSYVYA